ncbi:biopolymer transporter ExbD [Wenyingzhuangia sp. chi5]|uniref:Biopolymer transporter ExbD n=1 Tax=Wenyingzhuangia gilva TaxID=3057677 RepID=A0ABT8VU00_9FLAO|nr:biopolymer transporter ExbD [Wenyingzhuangia sp. chi5]MDO3695428.1 biopolymer transporter ExbD [Wenyingzhuangia sp. chi5]
MSKFGKKKKEVPAVNTAALPDIVFMLLFFFMVSTTMRETSLLIKKPKLPSATEVKKLEHKSLVSTIYVGKAVNPSEGTGDKIQLNDKISTVNDIVNFVYSERDKHDAEEQKAMVTSIKADMKTNVGTISDIKDELQSVNALKISYSSSSGDVANNFK